MAALPANAQSKIFTAKQLLVLNRLGDIMFPAYDDFPSFSTLGCIEHVDDIAAYLHPQDAEDMGGLLNVFAVCPTVILRFVVWVTQVGQQWPAVGGLVRMLDIGLRSIILTLYFSGKGAGEYTGKTPLELIDYHVTDIPAT